MPETPDGPPVKLVDWRAYGVLQFNRCAERDYGAYGCRDCRFSLPMGSRLGV